MTEQQTDLQERELDYWMTRAYEAEGKLWKAEARIKAVRDVLDTYEEEDAKTSHRYPTPHGDGLGPTLVDAGDIRRALDGA